nr:unnamed protein product [Digitaria exilis]
MHRLFYDWNESTAILTSASLVRNSSDENKINENLRIEVLLPSMERKEGTLEHYNLHYNVALVSVKDRHHLRAVNPRLSMSLISHVAAVGRCFQSGSLMAMSGRLVSWSGTLDCDFLVRSSCKITKAGIGGPLITLDGDVLGMNFYDKKIGTPFLSWRHICKILASFEGKSNVEVCDGSDPSGGPFWKMPSDATDRFNRWPVPMPYWCLPKDKPEVHDDGDVFTVGYIMGTRTMLC